MSEFLAESRVIDWRNPQVMALANELYQCSSDRNEFVRRAFDWVRDEIFHTGDHGHKVVTCSASDVLKHRTGFCYAKSHLLVAICRAQGVPAGLGYQRLSINGDGPPYCLHGFAAVELEGEGWRRLDPRGNNPGISTDFSISHDCLAFTPVLEGESTFNEILTEPHDTVVAALTGATHASELLQNLPDLAALRPVS